MPHHTLLTVVNTRGDTFFVLALVLLAVVTTGLEQKTDCPPHLHCVFMAVNMIEIIAVRIPTVMIAAFARLTQLLIIGIFLVFFA